VLLSCGRHCIVAVLPIHSLPEMTGNTVEVIWFSRENRIQHAGWVLPSLTLVIVN